MFVASSARLRRQRRPVNLTDTYTGQMAATMSSFDGS
jgi:hypothetical protein